MPCKQKNLKTKQKFKNLNVFITFKFKLQSLDLIKHLKLVLTCETQIIYSAYQRAVSLHIHQTGVLEKLYVFSVFFT